MGTAPNPRLAGAAFRSDSPFKIHTEVAVRNGPRVLMPFANASGGGSFVSAALLAHGLTALGCRVVALFPTAGPAHALFRRYSADVRIVNMPVVPPLAGNPFGVPSFVGRSGYLTLAACAYLRSNRFDIVHCNDGTTVGPWGIAAWRASVPCVWHVRSARRGISDRIRTKLATLAICVSDFVAARVPSHVRRLTIYNPVDHALFRPAGDRAGERKALGLGAEGFLLVHAGRDSKHKRAEWAISALKSALRHGHDARLLYLGDFSPSRQVELLSKLDAEWRPRVSFYGWVDNPERYLRACDLLLHPARGEKFGLDRVLIEAAACGLPVLSTRSGASMEVVTDGATGRLADAANQDDFCATLVKMLGTSGDLPIMARKALRRASGFTVEAHARQVLAAYSSILAGDGTLGERSEILPPKARNESTF